MRGVTRSRPVCPPTENFQIQSTQVLNVKEKAFGKADEGYSPESCWQRENEYILAFTKTKTYVICKTSQTTIRVYFKKLIYLSAFVMVTG